ncbi:MAG: putative type nitrate/sulfonate/bicarbonate transport system, permease component [Ramlibacter sp.]|jgi:NitT/TauT family transport system permease protein|uniref:ABC transporter permease n=1 Tax=Ramlibacter sp. TaxID=1917967 RepID=UPI0026052C83|nr:ABC transporter permease [Ramlibacter sp.]MDB5749912.1 putative type nitrate/sulfonate/bicarbonate transport system, permease component [Ramlibacter sp.]
MKTRAASLLLPAGLLLLWELAARGFAISALVLPPPSAVLQALWSGLASGFFWPHLRATALGLLLGMVAGSAFGFAAGVVLAEHAGLRRLLLPYVVVTQVVPKLALMPLFIVWFGFGLLPTVVVTALICFFPLMENTLTGLAQVAPERLELFRMLGASRAQTLWRLKLPTGLPAILAGLRIAVVLALVGVVVGEFIGTSQGLGALIIGAQGSMDTPLMFAVLVLVCLLGLCAYQAALLLERRLLRPYSSTS